LLGRWNIGGVLLPIPREYVDFMQAKRREFLWNGVTSVFIAVGVRACLNKLGV